VLSRCFSLGHAALLRVALAAVQRERSATLCSVLAQHLPYSVMPAAGGGSCWVSLPSR
jgi:hypothetical protein